MHNWTIIIICDWKFKPPKQSINCKKYFFNKRSSFDPSRNYF